jgi:hypothetical protein
LKLYLVKFKVFIYIHTIVVLSEIIPSFFKTKYSNIILYVKLQVIFVNLMDTNEYTEDQSESVLNNKAINKIVFKMS